MNKEIAGDETNAHNDSGHGDVGDTVKKISEALTEAVDRLINLGGIGLLVLVISAVMMALGVQQKILPVFWSGFAVLFVALAYIGIAGWIKRKDVKESLTKNGELADALQKIAVNAMEASLRLQTVLLVNVDSVSNTLIAAKPVLKLFGAEGFADQTHVRENIVTTLDAAGELFRKAQTAIRKADVGQLDGYSAELGKLSGAFRVASFEAPPSLESLRAEFSSNLERLRTCVADFCECVEGVNARSLGYVQVVGLAGPMVRKLFPIPKVERATAEIDRMEKMLTLTSTANRALAAAVEKGSTADLVRAAESVVQLRQLVQQSPAAGQT